MMKQGTQSVPEASAPVDSGDLVDRLYDRSADLREKFIDGRGRSFKREYPGWFAAFVECIGMMRASAERIEMLEEKVRHLEASPWYRDYVEVGRQVLELHERLVSGSNPKEG